jgi:sensor histidine kinase YesM
MTKTKFLKIADPTELLERYSPVKMVIFSLISAIFIIYPNISFFMMERNYLGEAKHTVHLLFFIFRYLYFAVLIGVLLYYNLRKIVSPTIRKRLVYNFLLTLVAYLLYISFSYILSPKPEWISGPLLFQFFVTFVFCALIGHVSQLRSEQTRKEREIEQLKTENIQSRYVALTNQINPHFFFNSLNGLTSLIRKKNEENAIEYVNKLSDIFRYVLQSDKKSVVTLREELESVKALQYMMEVRFANKLVFHNYVKGEHKKLKIPVLSLLPLIDNVVVHNVIDSEHNMEVMICLNDQMELLVSNPVYPKLTPANTNGTGLKNLETRFLLLINKQIRIKNDGERFTVYLPLLKEKDDNIDR